MSQNYRFFANKECEYFPCHEGVPEEEFNCLFCYCPLYFLGSDCGGGFEYTEKGVKNCTGCSFPHHKDHYDLMIGKIRAAIKKTTDGALGACPCDSKEKAPEKL